MFANVQTHYHLNIYPVYKPTIDSRLRDAKPLIERQRIFLSLFSEQAEELVSFRPWWSGHENRTICFVAESMEDNVYFYADRDVFPINYITDLFDTNGILTIPADSDKYMTPEGDFGNYYVRIRPQYKFADVVEDQTYQLNFYGFSQPPADSFTELYANNTVMGVANTSQVPTQYRHFLIAHN